MTFGSSYFGHFATITDRFQCSIGGPFVVSGSKDGGRIWSKDYKCVIGNLSHGFDHGITAAVQPIDGSMIVTVSKGDDSIKIWRSKKFLQKEIVVPNDFM